MAALNRELRRNVVAAFLSVAVMVPLVWMLMDRDPPFVRARGEIAAADPEECGLPDGRSRNVSVPIRAGSCVKVTWTIKTIRNCPAAREDNVVRHLRDSLGVIKPIGSVHRVASEHEASLSTVGQYLVLPSPLPAGPATYNSVACFACNPLQRLFWPVCVNEPDISFEVEK